MSHSCVPLLPALVPNASANAPAIAPVVLSEVDADVVQPEKLGKMHVLTHLQTILASCGVQHKERVYVQPHQFSVWLQRVLPADNQPKFRNTVFYSVLAKRFKVELKMARQSVNDLTPSKQEISLGTAYSHLEIVPFPVEHRTPPEDRMEQSPEATGGYKAWQFFKDNRNPELPTLN